MTRRRAIMVLGASATVVALLSAAAWLGGFRLNLTPSEPLGLWRIESPSRAIAAGDLVFVCPPEAPLFEEARRRSYLARGLCSGGVAPLIKSVAALPGQHVEIGKEVRIDGRLLPSSCLRRTDGVGRPLTAFAGGIVPPGTLYLHSRFASSYDSRYFGPIPETGLLGLARPVLTVDP
ncbi:conjugative transfer signal peptidase TraF [Rhizobium sp. BT03]|uniref:conjugative transfer signal peptidase TraF n=1 Tax=Rhizobium sp. BT03 TaxID=3045156 RepID=UPI0024B3DAAD|nr:conjugative transfer signal peptidase TraF [Rhizobium sp. BT03]WHO77311.1 conjugative transfer signal peptidase TraF [Rhizobium sp. BT03]